MPSERQNPERKPSHGDRSPLVNALAAWETARTAGSLTPSQEAKLDAIERRIRAAELKQGRGR